MSEEKVSIVKKIAKKCEIFLGKVIKYAIWNPILPGLLMFVVGARLYESGFFVSKGSNVMISGICLTDSGEKRSDLAQDQIIITKLNDKEIGGVLRKTRESVICNKEEISIDSMAPVYQIFSFKTDSIPELKKFEAPKAEKVVYDFKKYENKQFLVSGICKSGDGKTMPAFVDKKVSIANVKELKDEPGEFLFYGIREDKETIACKSTDVTLVPITTSITTDSELTEIKQPVSYKGMKVAITGFCTPDFRVYKDTQRKPEVNFYDLTNTPVEIIQETIKEDKVIEIAGIIADKEAKIGNISVYTHRIICTAEKYPLSIKKLDDESVQLEGK